MWGQAHGSFLIIADANFMQLLLVLPSCFATEKNQFEQLRDCVHVGMNYSTSTCIALTGVPILVSHFQGRGAPCHLPLLRWLVRNSCLRILHRDSKTWRGRTKNALTPSRRLRLDCLFYLESCDVTSNGRKTGEMGKICRLRSSIGWRFRQAEFGRLTTPTDDRPSVRLSVRPSSEVRKRKGGGDGSKP